MPAQNGINISHQKATKFTPHDFDRFDKTFVMDHSNVKNVKQMAVTPNDHEKVTLLLEGDEVPDPYYGNEDSFKKVFKLIDRACDIWIETLQRTEP